MINAGWIPPDKDVAEVRETIAQIAKDKTDARAAVMAANFLFNAEAAVIQSALAIHAAQIDQDPEDSDEEDGEHTCRPGEHDFRGIPGNVDPSISVDAETP